VYQPPRKRKGFAGQNPPRPRPRSRLGNFEDEDEGTAPAACFEAGLLATYAPVQDLIKKIEADAKARLPLPTNSNPAERLARYKGFLKVETHRLKLQHRAGGGGREICQARAAILDALLRHLWAEAKNSLSA